MLSQPGARFGVLPPQRGYLPLERRDGRGLLGRHMQQQFHQHLAVQLQQR